MSESARTPNDPRGPAGPSAGEPVTAGDPPAREPGGGSGVAILMAISAALAAILAGRASLVSSSASSDWQSAVRTEVKRGAATIEDISFVYSGEAPVAFLVARSNILAEELGRREEALPKDAASRLRLEVAARSAVTDNLVGGVDVTNPRYMTEDGGFNLALRLSDEQERNADLVALDPKARQAEGDRASRHARLSMATTIPVAVAFLLGALAQTVPTRRRPFIVLGMAVLAIGVVAAVAVEVMV